MKELSLNILDIAQNSVKAGATQVDICLTEDEETLTFTITDNGCGMSADFLARVTDPFTTTRTTRKVGLGLPLLKMEAEMTGGSMIITSRSIREYPENHGTAVTATFVKSSIDYIPLGDIIGTVCVLVQGAGKVDFLFTHRMPRGCVELSTAEMRQMLGPEVPLDTPEVLTFVREYLADRYQAAGEEA